MIELNDTIIMMAEVSELINLMPWISSKAKSLGFDDSQTREIQLALEEIFVNIALHAYKDKSPGKVSISSRVLDGFFQIELKDEAEAFDPTEEKIKIADSSIDLMDIEEGGLGLIFVRSFMDGLDYKREGGKNIVTLSKFIP